MPPRRNPLKPKATTPTKEKGKAPVHVKQRNLVEIIKDESAKRKGNTKTAGMRVSNRIRNKKASAAPTTESCPIEVPSSPTTTEDAAIPPEQNPTGGGLSPRTSEGVQPSEVETAPSQSSQREPIPLQVVQRSLSASVGANSREGPPAQQTSNHSTQGAATAIRNQSSADGPSQPRCEPSTSQQSQLGSQPAASNHSEGQNQLPPSPAFDTVNMEECAEQSPTADSESRRFKKIRLRESMLADGTIVPSGRGVVCGAKLTAEVRGLKSRIRLEKGADGTPLYNKWRKLLVHEIGRYVKESVPMNVASFSMLGQEVWQNIVDHISAFFVIEREDDWLKTFIMEIAARRFRGWKSSCHAHYLKYKEDLPYEFRNRPQQWQWLCEHFSTPDFKEKSQRMVNARVSSDHINHCSGKTPYAERVEKYIAEGNKAPLIATLKECYKKDPKGLEFGEKLDEKLNELRGQEGLEGDEMGELSQEEQFRAIEAVRGKKRGTTVLGASVRRPPIPRGGSVASTFRAYEDLQAELQKTREDQAREREEMAAFKRDMEAKWNALAEHVQFNIPAAAQAPNESTSLASPTSQGS